MDCGIRDARQRGPRWWSTSCGRRHWRPPLRATTDAAITGAEGFATARDRADDRRGVHSLWTQHRSGRQEARDGATFECRLDESAWTPCTGPQYLFNTIVRGSEQYTGLATGPHAFEVRAVDSVGNADPSPASFTWTIDRTPPDTSIVVNPAAAVQRILAVLRRRVDEAGLALRLRGRHGSVDAVRELLGRPVSLTDGQYTVHVRATDAMGNVGP